MNPKKPKSQKSRSAGISLEPQLVVAAKAKAKGEGYASLSAYVRFLLVQSLKAAGHAVEELGHKHQAAAKAKLHQRKKTR